MLTIAGVPHAIASFTISPHVSVPSDGNTRQSAPARDARLFFSPHFVDNEWWAGRAAAAGDSIKMKMKIKERATTFLFAGKFIPKKRVMDLLEAAARVPEARVVLVGDGALRSQLEERSARADIKGRVEFADFKNQQELPAYLAGADCLVLPSDGTETWGLLS